MLVPLNDDSTEGLSILNISIYFIISLLSFIILLGIVTYILKPLKIKEDNTLKLTVTTLEENIEKIYFFNNLLNNDLDNIIKSIYPPFEKVFIIEGKPEKIDIIKAKLSILKSFIDMNRKYKEFLSDIPSIFPTLGGGNINSPFGVRVDPFTGELGFHTGVDIFRLPGVPVRATGNGIVKFAGWNPQYGFMVIIEHSYGYSTLYAHMQPNLMVTAGDRVKRGQFVGYVGSTGRSLGYHLHYEVKLNDKFLNPADFLYKFEEF